MAVFPSSSTVGLKLKTLLRFPYRVIANGGVKAPIANGVMTLGLDYPTLTPNAGIADPSLFTIAAYNTATEEYEEVPLDQVPTTTTGDVRTPRGDADYSILATDRYVALTATLTAARAWTLPAASDVPGGARVTIQDEAGGVSSTNTITVGVSGADTINGASSYVMATARGGVEFRSDGTSKWSVRVLEDGAITDAKFRDSAGLSVVGRSANTTGDVADITAGTDDFVLRRSGTAIGFGQVATGGLAANAVTNAKLAQVATSTFKGRLTSGTGDVEDLTLSQMQTAIGAAMVVIETKTISNQATLDFQSFGSTYRRIELDISDLLPASAADLLLRLEQGGAFISSADYRYHAAVDASNAATYAALNSAGGSSFPLSGTLGTVAGNEVSGKITIHRPASTSASRLITWEIGYNASGIYRTVRGGGSLVLSAAVTGARLLMSSGNLISGTVKAYGYL